VPPLPTALSVGGGTYAGTILAIAADASKTWTSFTLAAVVTNTTYSIVQPEVYFKSGEQSSLKVEVTGTKTFEFGGSFLVTAAMTQLNEFKKMVDDRSQPKDEAGAYPKLLVKPNGTSQSVLATFKLAPVDWVFGSASYKYTQTAYEISDAKTQLSFESTTPETTQEYTLIVGLQKTF
jgi:hypothetical protein